RIYQKLIREKKAKGYCEGSSGAGHVSVEKEGKDSGVRCQLLNPIEETEISRLLRDDRWCAQEKFDGRRMLVRKEGTVVTGINRRRLFIAVPASIANATLELPFDFVIDGEAIGDTLFGFDLLELRG